MDFTLFIGILVIAVTLCIVLRRLVLDEPKQKDNHHVKNDDNDDDDDDGGGGEPVCFVDCEKQKAKDTYIGHINSMIGSKSIYPKTFCMYAEDPDPCTGLKMGINDTSGSGYYDPSPDDCNDFKK